MLLGAFSFSSFSPPHSVPSSPWGIPDHWLCYLLAVWDLPVPTNTLHVPVVPEVSCKLYLSASSILNSKLVPHLFCRKICRDEFGFENCGILKWDHWDQFDVALADRRDWSNPKINANDKKGAINLINRRILHFSESSESSSNLNRIFRCFYSVTRCNSSMFS